jgi:hypothetical protein
VLSTSKGIGTAGLGGRLDLAVVSGGLTEDEEAAVSPLYSTRDARGLKGANNENLLTYEWPEDIGNKSSIPAANKRSESGAIAELAAALCPRYHFAVGWEEFWERAV